MFFASAWSGYVTIASIYGGDGLFLGICAHLSSEFAIIGSRIEELIEEEISEHKTNGATDTFDAIHARFSSVIFTETHESSGNLTREQNDRVYRKLQKIVIEHGRIIALCKILSQCLSHNVLIHYITSALVTCICCLMIMLAEGAAKLIFVNYIVASTTQVFVYSYGGTLLEDASISIKKSAYNMQWYRCDVRIQKMVLMIIMRAQKRSAVNVPFFEVSLETFMAVSSKNFYRKLDIPMERPQTLTCHLNCGNLSFPILLRLRPTSAHLTALQLLDNVKLIMRTSAYLITSLPAFFYDQIIRTAGSYITMVKAFL